MMKNGDPCPLCGGREIIPALETTITGDQGALGVRLTKPERSGKWFQTLTTAHTDLRAWICGSCGYAELHAEDPRRLLAAYREGWR